MNSPPVLPKPSHDSPPDPAAPPAATPADGAGAEPDDMGYDLLLYGTEQIMRGSDNGVLVAFAALAFQQIRGGTSLPHFNVGFGFLIFSVLMCGVVHFAMGTVYVGRGRRLIRGQNEKRRHRLSHGAYTAVAWAAGLIQLVCILVGLILVMFTEPPTWLRDHLLRYFID